MAVDKSQFWVNYLNDYVIRVTISQSYEISQTSLNFNSFINTEKQNNFLIISQLMNRKFMKNAIF
jgi:hypothetical protein